MKRLISLFISIVLSSTFVTSVFAEPVTSKENLGTKFSEYLLEEYGVSRESLEDTSEITLQNDEKIPVLVWCANDIDHSKVLREALDIIINDLSEKLNSLKFIVTESTTLDDILKLGLEPSADAIQKYVEKEREISRDMYTELNKKFTEKHMVDNEIIYTSLYSPVVIVNISLDEALELACDKQVLGLAYSGSDFENIDELDISTEVIEANRTHSTYGYTGSGVKIGQVDGGVPDINDIQLSPISTNIHINNSTYISSHASWVADIMVGQHVSGYSSGIAPNAELYCTPLRLNGVYYLEGVEWLLTNGANVINASVRFGDDDNNQYGAYSMWLDHIAINHFATFVKSAGNSSSSGVTSGGMAYNIITVGNIDDRNTLDLSDDILRHTSSYYIVNTNLAYKPDICAPGTNISNAAYPNGESGTSASAPHVVGTIALMFEARPVLRIFPEVVKSILTATVNPNSRYRYCVSSWSTNNSVDGYAKFGSGLLDTYNAVEAARNYNYSYGSLSSSYTTRTCTMNVNAPNSNIRVSLAFNKNNNVTSTHTSTNYINVDPLQDLDLRVYAPDGTLAAWSITYYNNVENVEFIASQAGAYTIKINKIVNSYTESVQYGISWMEVD